MVITLEEETKKKHMALSSTDTRLAQYGNVEDDGKIGYQQFNCRNIGAYT